MTITITSRKTKTALAALNKTRKKTLEHKTSLVAIASAAPPTLLPEMRLQKCKLSDLKGLKKRVRKSDKDQVGRVAKSLQTFGQCVPVLISADREIINGHIIGESLRRLGEKEAWCVEIEHLDEHQRAALHVTLNRLGECGDWQSEELGALLVELKEVGFELETTVFTLPELDILMAPPIGSQGSDDAEVEDLEPPSKPVSVLGDLWQLGQNDANHLALLSVASARPSFSIFEMYSLATSEKVLATLMRSAARLRFRAKDGSQPSWI